AGARMTAGWAMLALALVLTAAPALASYAKLYLYRGILGLTSEEVGAGASWLLNWSGHDSISDGEPMARLCGQVAELATQAVAACGGNPDYVVGPADIRLAPEIITFGAADMFGLPGIFAGLVSAAALAGALAGANAVAFSIGANVSSGLATSTTGSERQTLIVLFRARFAVVLALALSAWLAIRFNPSPLEVFLWALAVVAGIVLPVLVAAIWWTRLNANGALAGLVSGALVLLVQAWSAWSGADGVSAWPALPAIPALAELTPALTAAIYAFAATGLVLAAVSLSTSPRENAIAPDAMLRPDADPLAPELEI
ncbi:MAG: hypothetical protein VYD64_10750, partial [Pseudomonadota bacterium]|nr:hypothetical protein [Pseudomonadota bacterium]